MPEHNNQNITIKFAYNKQDETTQNPDYKGIFSWFLVLCFDSIF